MSINKGKFISIEGIEGAGKSTAMQFVKQHFAASKINCFLTREPGGTQLAEQLRQLVLHAKFDEEIQPETELLLMFAGRAQHLAEVIIPQLNKGVFVISDRFIDASYAYQGGGRQINIDSIKLLDKLIVKNNYPDLTILLDISPEAGLLRAERRANKDRIEQEKKDFFTRVREVYLQRAATDPKRIKIINADLPLKNVQKQITKVLDDFIKI